MTDLRTARLDAKKQGTIKTKKARTGWEYVVGLTIVVVLVALALAAIGGYILRGGLHEKTVSTVTTPTTTVQPTCPAASTEHQTCSYGDQTVWASTGTVPPGAKPKVICLDRQPSRGDFSFFDANGGSPDPSGGIPSGEIGFRAPQGQTRASTYWLADSFEDCSRT